MAQKLQEETRARIKADVMHPNAVVHTQHADQTLDFARQRAVGGLAVSGTKAPWLSHVAVLPDETGASLGLRLLRSDPMARAARAIVLCRMSVGAVDGTWKLNQNRAGPLRLQATDHVTACGQGADLAVLAALMRGATAPET